VTPLDIALAYIGRGWNPVPVEYPAKKPIGNAWQSRIIDAGNAAQHFNGEQMNIGVVLGPTSRKLTDVDEDANEAICIGPYILPRTRARFGRASKRESHRLYYTELSAIAGRPAVIAFDDPRKPKQQGRLIELRIGGDSGAQSVLPGSVHKSGESIAWEEDGEPAIVNGDDLLRRVRIVAAYSLLARYWPAEGSGHHDTARVVGGFLARAGLGPETIRIHVESIAKAANSSRWKELCRTAEDAAKAFAAGKHAFGFNGLREAFGVDIAEKVAEWLDYSPEVGRQKSPELAVGSSATALFVSIYTGRRWHYRGSHRKRFGGFVTSTRFMARKLGGTSSNTSPLRRRSRTRR
jgi:Bifunctional DNA primase/polymerase, N-terminal